MAHHPIQVGVDWLEVASVGLEVALLVEEDMALVLLALVALLRWEHLGPSSISAM